ncbi:hypothetical protein HETIRDRAFT_322377 [Heterobasidion irregulare TC 32-1]|uniref:Uncharacterized protein n=1 Tax=Heterobasidion irregulare (strain TC 32-1) TaxID=747525 RepID=W4K1A6_HETIT|nr:uncharacterized protein HETIRDRAFT_322377 [Heterobasidion irregulare TC 32-1]ETW79504.1 hypothetical protein HETIRDRAFT_322377 [Heterobasidion irregulare TC 32-1]
MKCGQTDPSAAECPSVGYSQLGGNQPCLVIVGVFSTHLALFSISPKLPKYLPWTLAWMHAYHHSSLVLVQLDQVCSFFVGFCGSITKACASIL